MSIVVSRWKQRVSEISLETVKTRVWYRYILILQGGARPTYMTQVVPAPRATKQATMKFFLNKERTWKASLGSYQELHGSMNSPTKVRRLTDNLNLSSNNW